jgi:hypothetical protein
VTDAHTSGDVCYRTRAATHAVVLDDEVLIWDAAGVRLHRLNSSASKVWLALAGWRSAEQVVAALAPVVGVGAADVDASRLRDDVVSCIGQLARAGLLDWRPSSWSRR